MSGTTRPAARAGSRASADRLARLLNLVPYLLARPGIEIAEAAGDLGVTERQLREDLELLWVCGLPGYGPGDLIDMAFDGDRVTITYDAGIDRPLRLTPDEALALVVALRMLAETPGVANREAVERALAKIEDAGGDLVAAPVEVRLPGDTGRVEQLRAAVEGGRALRITYYTATRDETTERVIDPLRVLMVGGRTYVEAWCRRAEAVRLFRADRIDAVTELAEPAVVPPQAQPHDLREGAFRPSPDLPLITLRIGRGSGGSPSTTRVSGSSPTVNGGWCRCASPTSAGPAGSCSASARTSRSSRRPSWPGRSTSRRWRPWRRTRSRCRPARTRRRPATGSRLAPVLKWIVLALVLVPLVLLALAVRPVLARLPRLRRAALALQRRADEATALREAAESLQQRAEGLQSRLETTQQRLTLIRSRRGD
ncbi:hypothetical protein GCM10029963_06710 [Micromonospora andamanensis]